MIGKKQPLNNIPNTFQLRAEELAKQFASNARARNLIKNEQEKIQEELIELMIYREYIPKEIKVVIPISPNKTQSFIIKLVDRREKVQDFIAIVRNLISPFLKQFIIDQNIRVTLTESIAILLQEYMRKDALLVKKLIDNKEWVKKYISEEEIKHHIVCIDQFGGYI